MAFKINRPLLGVRLPAEPLFDFLNKHSEVDPQVNYRAVHAMKYVRI